MAPETLASVFASGFSTKEGRFGLQPGLPYTKCVMDEVGGQVRILSHPGQGTEVSLVLSSNPESMILAWT